MAKDLTAFFLPNQISSKTSQSSSASKCSTIQRSLATPTPQQTKRKENRQKSKKREQTSA